MPLCGSNEETAVHAILDAGLLAHIGFTVDSEPFVIPTLYAREGNTLYVHGSSASRMMRQLETGIPACITVSIVDGLVLARSAFHHSINYRSAVLFGTARKIEDNTRKNHALLLISEHVVKGRWDQVRPPTEHELKATTVLEFQIEEASAKVRFGPPADDEEDYALPVWAGVLPLALTPGTPLADPRLPAATPIPAHVADWPL
jgi:nitroimidazol reductase NimA-like FMN-containing flavoprotein (pyridoxamine 5'-phosphate oxidase superfamily)